MKCNTRPMALSLFSPPGITLVHKSAGLHADGIFPALDSFIATDSLHVWYAIEFDFFFRVDSGLCVLWITDMF